MLDLSQPSDFSGVNFISPYKPISASNKFPSLDLLVINELQEMLWQTGMINKGNVLYFVVEDFRKSIASMILAMFAVQFQYFLRRFYLSSEVKLAKHIAMFKTSIRLNLGRFNKHFSKTNENTKKNVISFTVILLLTDVYLRKSQSKF